MRKSVTMKQQLDMYKRQVHEIQNKLYDETKRADKADFERKRAVEKMTTLQREKEVLILHRVSHVIYSHSTFIRNLVIIYLYGESCEFTASLKFLMQK